MGVAEGYNTIQFAGVGNDFQVIKDINAMYKAQGKPAPTEQEVERLYNRGVMIAAMHVEAVRNAIKAKGGAQADQRGRQEGHGGDQGLHAGRPGAADGDHARPTTRAAAGCRSGPSRAASSSRTATGSRPIAT